MKIKKNSIYPASGVPIALKEYVHTDPEGYLHYFHTRLTWLYEKYPHALLIGGTGTGKTTALKQLVDTFLTYVPEAEIYLCTFKHKNDDFPDREEGSHFASYLNCKELFESFFNRFQDRLDGTDHSRHLLVLCFDEWAGFILSLNKKEQEAVLNQMGQILMMGRSMNVQIIIAMQRPDATFFRNGSRDNFGLIMALGNLSADGYRMVFSDQYLNQIQPCTEIGQGHLLIGGSAFYRIRVPPVHL